MKIEDRKQLKKLAIEQIKEDFKIIKEKTEGEELFTFALGLVDDIAGFYSVGNTIERLRKIFNEDDDGNKDNYKRYELEMWGVEEWEYDGGRDNSVSDFLTEIVDFDSALEDEKFYSFKNEYEQILIEALQHCKENKFLGEDEIVIYLYYVDASNEEIDNISSAKINSEELHNSFKNKYSGKEVNLSKVIFEKITSPNKV